MIPQPGPWEKGRQTLLRDLLRSLGQVGAVMVIGAQGGCEGEGPVIVRASYSQRVQARGEGVTSLEWGDEAHFELWKWDKWRIPVVRAPHVVVQWLKAKGIHHMGDLVVKKWGMWVWKDWVMIIVRAREDPEDSYDSDQTNRKEESARTRKIRLWLLSMSAERRRWPREVLHKWLDWKFFEYIENVAKAGSDKVAHMGVEKFQGKPPPLDAMHPFRRVYPHLVRSRDKEGPAIIVQGVGRVEIAERIAKYIDAEIDPGSSAKTRWKNLVRSRMEGRGLLGCIARN